MMYWEKETAVNRSFRNMMVWCWGGEAFCSLRIRAQAFTEPMPLDWELQRYFSVVFSLLSGTKQLELVFPFRRSIRL